MEMNKDTEFYVDLEIEGVAATPAVIDALENLMDVEGAHIAAFACSEAGERVAVSFVTTATSAMAAGLDAQLVLAAALGAPVADLVVSLKVRTGAELDAELDAELGSRS